MSAYTVGVSDSDRISKNAVILRRLRFGFVAVCLMGLFYSAALSQRIDPSFYQSMNGV